MTSEIKVNNIKKASGSTITIGESGDTISLASGASQTGFGRTGTVNWQTTIKTGDFTAVSGEGYFVNTTSGEIDVTLPSSPSAGDIVSLKDYARTWETNNCIVLRNGSNLDGNAENSTFKTSGKTLTFIYMDATKGWSLINDDDTSNLGAEFIAATGGTITTVCTNFKVHTFTSPGTFQVTNAGNSAGSNEISYMVVAGGGGSGGDSGGGGGAGGFREGKTPQCTYTQSPIACTSGSNNGLPVAVASYPVTVGGGGTAGTGAPPGGSPTQGGDGSPSTFAGTTSITSTGGGGGGSRPSPNGRPGGSGGGARSQGGSAGSGNTPPVSPSQGFDGGGATPTPTGNSGGGGGATAIGLYNSTPNCSAGGPGGAGATTSINGSPTAFAGGGGGGGSSGPTALGGPAGTGGGGAGVQGSAPNVGNAGTANTGGGGGGGGDDATGAAGGSGIVIIRYKFQ